MARGVGQRPEWSAGRSERFELEGTKRQNRCAQKMHTRQNNLEAEGEKKEEASCRRGVKISFIKLHSIPMFETSQSRPPPPRTSVRDMSSTHLWSCVKAHKPHAEVDGQSHEVALHDARIRFTLQRRRTTRRVPELHKDTKPPPSSPWKWAGLF